MSESPRSRSSSSSSSSGSSSRGSSKSPSPVPVKEKEKEQPKEVIEEKPKEQPEKKIEEEVVANNPVILVERLTKNVHTDHLNEIFGPYGTIKKIEFLKPGKGVSFKVQRACIEFENIDQMEQAIVNMHEAQIDGNFIRVDQFKGIAEEKEDEQHQKRRPESPSRRKLSDGRRNNRSPVGHNRRDRDDRRDFRSRDERRDRGDHRDRRDRDLRIERRERKHSSRDRGSRSRSRQREKERDRVRVHDREKEKEHGRNRSPNRDRGHNRDRDRERNYQRDSPARNSKRQNTN